MADMRERNVIVWMKDSIGPLDKTSYSHRLNTILAFMVLMVYAFFAGDFKEAKLNH